MVIKEIKTYLSKSNVIQTVFVLYNSGVLVQFTLLEPTLTYFKRETKFSP